jgi:hypothetical protein
VLNHRQSSNSSGMGSKRLFQVEIFGLFSSLAIAIVGVGMYSAMSYGLRQPHSR